MDKSPSSDAVKYCILMPTYNNATKLPAVLDQIVAFTSDVIVVNDGSTDDTAEILSSYEQITCLTHDQNQGKGVALRNGFEKAISMAYDYAITIDSDGQHKPEDLPAIIQKMNEHKGSVIMGSRNMAQDGVPGASSFGNNFSNFWFWAETGIKLPDTQTGFRAYPLAPIAAKKWFTAKFEFEIEVIVRLAWEGVSFVAQPISVIYEEDRITHFRKFRDFTRISILNTFLVIAALAFFLPRLKIKTFSLRNTWNKFKTELIKNKDNPIKMSASVGLGLFFGIFPIWGFQMLVAFAIASLFKLNRLVVLFSSNISIPPMLPIIIFSSFLCGAPFVSHAIDFKNLNDISLDSIHEQYIQYMVGSTILSVLLFLLGFLITFIFMKMLKVKT